jgi:hypothetical protein
MLAFELFIFRLPRTFYFAMGVFALQSCSTVYGWSVPFFLSEVGTTLDSYEPQNFRPSQEIMQTLKEKSKAE